MLGHYRRFNEFFMVRLAAVFATPECFYAFTALVLVPFVWPQTLAVVQFLSSGLLQLIALPLIGVSGVIVGRAQDQRAARDHAALMYEVAALKRMNFRLEKLIGALHEKLEIDIDVELETDEGPTAPDGGGG